MKKNLHAASFAIFALALFSLTSCDKDDDMPAPYVAKVNTNFYALSGGTAIDKLNTINVSAVLNTATITGLQASETILAVDYRPSTGQLYGLGSTSRLYVINPETGVARAIGAAAFTPVLAGNVTGMDFNPTVDRLRVVTSTGQNLRLNPETGTVAATDLVINGVTNAMITGAAYTNNAAGAATTVLFDIDITTKKLYKQDPPNDGKLVEVGALNLDISGDGGFDIAPGDSIALGLYSIGGKATLFDVNLATGEGKKIAEYTKNYTGIAIPTAPVAYATDVANNLIIFNPTKSATTIVKAVTGLMAGERIIGLDMRPLNGQLYGITSISRIVTLNASSGVAAVVGTLSTPIVGTDVGFDFNPLVDRIRIVSNTGQNLRYNPNDPAAAVLVDGILNPGLPNVTAAAYNSNFAGTTVTTLFDIDVTTDKLYTQNPPNNGTLVEVGALGINAEAATGFDIGGTSNSAMALLSVGGATKLYAINTTTGAATLIADFPVGISGFTIGLGF